MSRVSPSGGAAFQFGLRDLFWMTLVLAVYFAMVRYTGEFVATLLVGIYFLWAVITLLRIDNMVLGGIVGTCLATALLVCAGSAFAPSAWLFILSCLAYPTLGYPLGVMCAGCRQIRHG